MYCNILHTLAPGGGTIGTYADRLFQAVLAHAQSVQSTSTVLFEDPTGGAEHRWLYDAMANLIQATLDNDPSLNGTVRSDLLKDINDLQTALGINEAQDAKTKAGMIVSKMAGLIGNMEKYMKALGWVASGVAKGASKAFSMLRGMCGFSQAEAVVERAARDSTKLGARTVGLLKGLGIVTLVSDPPPLCDIWIPQLSPSCVTIVQYDRAMA
jgi:hypothetical protein